MAKTITIKGVNFTQLTGKKADELVNEYVRAKRQGNMYLWDVYGRCSRAKQIAFDDCYIICNKLDGSPMYISSYNTCMFTLVYWFKHEDKAYIVKETHCNRYIAEFDLGALR